MDTYLAVDIGASGGRAIIGKLKGNVVSLEEIRRFANGMTQIHGRWHWDIYRLYEETKNGIKEAAKQNHQPASIGIDTWGVDYGLLDEAGRLLELPYAYRDARTENSMDEVFRAIPKERIYSLTGIQFLRFNTLFQLHAAVRDNLPALRMAKDLLFIPDLLNYFLTGVKSSEFTFATTSQLFNPFTRQWAPELFDAVGVPIGIMQDIVPPGTILATLTEDIAKETGLRDVDVTAVASHDTASAIAAIPARDGFFAYISSGTWSLMGIESEAPVITPESLEFNFTNEGGVAGSYRTLKNIMGLWLIQQCRKSWFDRGADFSHEALLALAASSEPFYCLIDPDHAALLNPHDMPEALGKLAGKAGEPGMRNPGEFSRCIFESLAFRYRQTLEELRRISNRDIRRIHIIGGGAQNRLLCQFTANATGIPVISGPEEATALGNIMVQAMAQGRIASHAEMRHVILNSFEFGEFTPENTGEWDARYPRFLDICARLRA